MTVKVCPATTSVPVRAPPGFAAIVKPTVPLPVPLAPEVIVIQLSGVVAVHPHGDGAVTAIVVPAPPGDPIDCVEGLMPNVHDKAGWLTLIVVPATVTLPLRALVLLLAATIWTVPEPFPEADEPNVNHAA